MADVPDPSRPSEVRLAVGPWPDTTPRYELLRLLGRGGMGEVRLAIDQRIGRHVAVKTVSQTMLGDAALDRFLREARIQGQLEHPSIVPVYDLARTVEGDFHFTMKRVQGRTLRSIVTSLRSADPEAIAAYPLRRLLSAFDQVCLAIAFAHSRGVIHRDLKPDNIMLGDFGEVYVLDWGLAKLVGAHDDVPHTMGALAQGDYTADGAMLGTLGYMPPEQLRSASEVDERSDVYALGAILFEILTLDRLHGGEPTERLDSTMSGNDTGPRMRASERDVAPELESVVVKATARDRHERLTAARAIHEAVQHYLDNDRDVALRRQASERHARAAATAAEHALGRAGSEDERRRALREAGRALALDPSNDEAMRTMMNLLVHPPKVAPREVVKRLDEAARARASTGARLASLSYLSLFLYVPVLVWMGVRSWSLMGALFGAIATICLMTYVASRLARQGAWVAIVAITLNTLVVAATTAIVGPFLVAPGFAAATSLALALHFDRYRTLTATLGCLAIIGPFLLERAGIAAPSYSFLHGAMLVVPRMVSLPEGATLLLLLFTSVTTIGITTGVGARMRDALTDAERRLVLHSWQLEHVVREPAAGAHDAAGASPESESSAAPTEPRRAPERAAEPCLTEEEVIECAAGRIDEARLERALAHLDTCESCRLLVSALAKDQAPPTAAESPSIDSDS